MDNLLETLQKMEDLTADLKTFLGGVIGEIRGIEFSGGGMTEDEVELLTIYRLMPPATKRQILNRCQGWRDGYSAGGGAQGR